MEGMSRMFGRTATQLGILAACLCAVGMPINLLAQTSPPPTPASVTLTVTDGASAQLPAGFRWLLEEDATYPVTPGVHDTNSLAYNFHRSYMPVLNSGQSASGSTTITIPDASKRYYISVLPNRPDGANCALASNNCFSISGGAVAPGQTAVTIVAPRQPIPTAQISIFAYEDNFAINNQWDTGEVGLGGFTIMLSDGLAGQMTTDVYGNPLGTVYSGVDGAGAPIIQTLGNGVITTMSAADVADPVRNPYRLQVGEALIKNIAPGKYGIRMIAPIPSVYSQTSTIEGTPGIDAWVKANEPRYFAEFGPAGHHVEMGFVKQFNGIPAPQLGQALGAVSGRVVNQRMSRPPDYTFSKGHPLANCWVGLNEMTLGAAGRGLYAQPCNADSTFSIPNVPAGSYQLVMWDTYLDNVFASNPVTVPAAGGEVALGDVGVFRWYGEQDHYVFYDSNGNGIRDPGEVGIPDQLINLRFRDGSIYFSMGTDLTGLAPMEEVFPWFNWLVAEVDYARFKATGVTVTVDAGGAVASGEKINPQMQAQLDTNGNVLSSGPTRTDTQPAPVLLQGVQTFLGTTNKFEWGKQIYGVGQNGGISGIVQYATTRAEDDPRYAAAETWEPGIPRVPVFLYQDKLDTAGNFLFSGDTIIDDINGVPGIQLSDVDHYPFGWSSGGAMGPEDVKRNGAVDGTAVPAGGLLGSQIDPAIRATVVFDAGDAVQIATSDSWDDNQPTNCPGNPADPFYQGANPDGFHGKCYDGLRNYNQVRPAVFDGGYAFNSYVPGGVSSGGAAVSLQGGLNYIVEAVAPNGYLHQKEEDKNVVFGDTSTVNLLALPAACVGDLHVVPGALSLFPNAGEVPMYAGQTKPLCDRKRVLLQNGQNASASFFLFTEVPAAGHIVGFILNDMANEFNALAPTFGEKQAPTWIPISIRDWTGRELSRVYSDEYGTYNALVPSTYTINPPMPSGVSSSMMQVCLNSPGPIRDQVTGTMIIDPYYNKQYSQFCYNFNWEPGRTTYLDTPVLPVSAFVGLGNWQLDCDCPAGTPAVHTVSAEGNGVGGGPYINPSQTTGNRVLTITSLGTVNVPDPNSVRTNGQSAQMIARDFGFGGVEGEVTVNGVRLTVLSWSNLLITAEVPLNATTGQLIVKRGDNGLKTVNTATVHIGNNPATVRTVAPNTTIQAAIDVANAGDLVLVPPGAYFEMVIMTKPVQLQAWGAEVTQINAVKSPTEHLQQWQEKVNRLANCAPVQLGFLPGQPNNTENAAAPCGHEPGTGLFATEEGAAVLVAPMSSGVNAFTSGRFGRIDGFTLTGSDQAPGVMANGYAHFLQISNNKIVNNQGLHGGGIRLGHVDLNGPNDTLYLSSQNDHVQIHHNHISQNGTSFAPGGGVALYTGSNTYKVTDNYICGNFSQGDGAGIAHYGLSLNGLIADNQILFNQGFEQTAAGGTGGNGSGAGILISGMPQPVGAAVVQSPGSGSVTINSNLIQGNHAESGDGGGVLLRNINGQDVVATCDPAQPSCSSSTWYQIALFNNTIVNNVAGLSAGGIALQDAVKVYIVNNTIAHNDSTATSGNAFTAGIPNVSDPQPAGIVAHTHTAALRAALPATNNASNRFSNPVGFANNIILNNRSMFWEVDTQVTPPIGQLKLSGVADLAVVPGVSGASTNRLNPLDSILTDVNTGYNSTNVLVDNSAEVLVQPYFNAKPGFGTVQPDGTYLQLEFSTTLASAAALDEGGNFIDVHYGPLSPVGDYHILAGSVAVDAGRNTYNNMGVVIDGVTYRFLQLDLDKQVRPMDGNGALEGTVAATTDIGPDELTGPNAAPVITSTAFTSATSGTLYTYQVVATDPNAGDTLTYSLSTFPVGMTINPTTGLISWTAANYNFAGGNTNRYRVIVTVTDQTGLSATQDYYLWVYPRPETISVTQAQLRNLPGTTNDSWTIAGTSTVPGGTLNIYRARTTITGISLAIINNVPVTVQADGSWSYTETPATPAVSSTLLSDTITVRSLTGGEVSGMQITVTTN